MGHGSQYAHLMKYIFLKSYVRILLEQHKIRAFVMSPIMQHYHHGFWNSNGTCSQRVPGFDQLTEMAPILAGMQHWLEISDICKLKVIECVDSYGVQFDRGDAHCGVRASGNWDCSHYCQPGVYDEINGVVFSRLFAHL